MRLPSIAQLLIQNTLFKRLWGFISGQSLKDTVNNMPSMGLSREFRETHPYNNQDYQTLAYVVGRLTNGSHVETATNTWVKPLGMNHTWYSTSRPEKRGR